MRKKNARNGAFRGHASRVPRVSGGDYFNRNPDQSFADKLTRIFVEKYTVLTGEENDPVNVFGALWEVVGQITIIAQRDLPYLFTFLKNARCSKNDYAE
jgi:hypothetical protein